MGQMSLLWVASMCDKIIVLILLQNFGGLTMAGWTDTEVIIQLSELLAVFQVDMESM